jgi:hypothetical protein
LYTHVSNIIDQECLYICCGESGSNQYVADSTSGWGTHLFNMDKENLELVQMLLARLERISADSYWAHRASGVRGSLLKILDRSERRLPIQKVELKRMMILGFFILEKAAKERA